VERCGDRSGERERDGGKDVNGEVWGNIKSVEGREGGMTLHQINIRSTIGKRRSV